MHGYIPGKLSKICLLSRQKDRYKCSLYKCGSLLQRLTVQVASLTSNVFRSLCSRSFLHRFRWNENCTPRSRSLLAIASKSATWQSAVSHVLDNVPFLLYYRFYFSFIDIRKYFDIFFSWKIGNLFLLLISFIWVKY